MQRILPVSTSGKVKTLLDRIPNNRKMQKSAPMTPKVDLKKESVAFMRNVDYCRVRSYNIRTLLRYELTSTSFFLVKDGFPRKPDKADLASEVKKFVECPTKVSSNEANQMIIIDFVGYARKVPIKN